MRQIFVAVLLVAISATIAAAQEEYKCVTPRVWYAHFMRFSSGDNFERRGRFYYDEDNERIAVSEEVLEGFNNTEFYDEIFLHKEKMGYRFDPRAKMCRSFPLNEPFPMIGPYLTDSYEGEAYIGSADEPKDGVRVQMYSGSNERGRFFGVWIPVEEGECIPVSESFTSVRDRTTSTTRYSDIRLGIFEPDVFQPPEYCMTPPPPPPMN